ncbi:hypothetical protein EDF71_1531 [Comamonas sp. JUb58]|nr:hypothetical protein EDF71_1531 [Comamonas sp. JUb58]
MLSQKESDKAAAKKWLKSSGLISNERIHYKQFRHAVPCTA